MKFLVAHSDLTAAQIVEATDLEDAVVVALTGATRLTLGRGFAVWRLGNFPQQFESIETPDGWLTRPIGNPGLAP